MKDTNLSPKMNHFYMKMDASLMHAMHIPKKFAETIKGFVNENIKLEVPSGLICWNVKMIRSNDTYILQSGWKDFVTANKIDKNDTLVFTYNGSCSFKVLIFDACGCEKLAPFFAKKSEESDDSSVRVGAAFHSEVKKEFISVSSCNDSESASQLPSHIARTGTTGGMPSYKRKQRDFLQQLTESESDEGNYIHVRTKEKRSQKKFRLYIVPRKTNLTKAQEDIADRMAQKAQKGSDLFVKILTQSSIRRNRSCSLILPCGFACNTLQTKKQMITLLPANLDKSKGCIAKYNYKNQNVKYISWLEFVRKNRLKVGDLCLFELRKKEIRGKLVLTMVVHFETDSKNSDDRSVQVGAALQREIKKEFISLFSGSDTETSSDISSRAVRALKRKRRDESTVSNEGRQRPIRKRKDTTAQRTSMLYIVPENINLTEAQEEIANRMTPKTQKGCKLFVKILTKCNTRVHGELNLPKGFACNVLQSQKMEIALVPADLEKRSKRITGNYSKNKSTRYIGKGWPDFVRRNGLKKGIFACLN